MNSNKLFVINWGGDPDDRKPIRSIHFHRFEQNKMKIQGIFSSTPLKFFILKITVEGN